jgi:hypothetical protein
MRTVRTLEANWLRIKRASVGTEDREMSHVLSVTGQEGFTMLLRMECNFKLMNFFILWNFPFNIYGPL